MHEDFATFKSDNRTRFCIRGVETPILQVQLPRLGGLGNCADAVPFASAGNHQKHDGDGGEDASLKVPLRSLAAHLMSVMVKNVKQPRQ
jgi:hypothetical protein